MTVEPGPGGAAIRLNQDPPENFCRPAVDPMLRSMAKVYGPNVLTVILTGMGNDGFKGSQVITASGGAVIAQDEATQRRLGHAARGRRGRPVHAPCCRSPRSPAYVSGVVAGRRS